MRRAVPILASPAVASPAVWGLVRPRLIVPAGLTERLTPGQWRWVLLHELAHIRRGDLWIATLQRLVQVAYFFHPAVWLASRMIDVQREYACDDAGPGRRRPAPPRLRRGIPGDRRAGVLVARADRTSPGHVPPREPFKEPPDANSRSPATGPEAFESRRDAATGRPEPGYPAPTSVLGSRKHLPRNPRRGSPLIRCRQCPESQGRPRRLKPPRRRRRT